MTIGRFDFGDIHPPFVTEDCKQSFVDFGSDFEYNEESIECNLEDYEIEILKLLDHGRYCKRKMILLVDKAISKFPGIQNVSDSQFWDNEEIQQALQRDIEIQTKNFKKDMSNTKCDYFDNDEDFWNNPELYKMADYLVETFKSKKKF
ncbi:unnamed protein product [Lactuca virosa]|uniref:Uncharacterized protein n=1 Tax=Lactuca virosa TaxID=75947 RepID=A0AAU9PVN1_9ASTR|nr:unnamed protein product [Lactuca virosa]